MADNTRSKEEIARLDARMAELDKYLKDPSMKLGRGPTGKFQFYKADQQKQAVSTTPKKTETAASASTEEKTSAPLRNSPPPAAKAAFRANKPRTGGAAISTSHNYEGRKKQEYLRTGVRPFGMKYVPPPFEPKVPDAEGMKKGGKVKTVMHEFKTGALKSSSGQKVTNPKQAVAIAMSEAGMKKAKKFAGKEGSYVGGSKRFEDLNKEMNRTGFRYDLDDSSEDTLKAIKHKVPKPTKPVAPPKKKYIEMGDDDMSADKYARGGKVKESKAMAKKEISFMKRKGAPKSMIKHEKAEYGMKKGGSTSCYAEGGSIDGIAQRGKTKTQHFAKGGSVSARADGVATKGKTNCKIC